jgi:hypothetical protein
MPIYPRDYTPERHGFEYTADICWPGVIGEQLDWVTGVTDVELWLIQYTGPKYSRWAWNTAKSVYNVSVAFKYDKHKTLFLLTWA